VRSAGVLACEFAGRPERCPHAHASETRCKARRDGRNDDFNRSFKRPFGTGRLHRVPPPNAEALGYSRMSLRDNAISRPCLAEFKRHCLGQPHSVSAVVIYTAMPQSFLGLRKFRNAQRHLPVLPILNFFAFEFVSDFGFRPSDFLIPSPGVSLGSDPVFHWIEKKGEAMQGAGR
jgi:hypothetical protein